MSAKPLRSILYLTTLATAVSSCGWVDATGRQKDDSNPPSTIGITVPTANDERLILIDAMPGELLLSNQDASLRGWRWHVSDTPADAGYCAGVSGHDPDLARSSLAEACAVEVSDDDCRLNIDEFTRDGRTGFRIETPALRAPFVARYTLTAVDDTGASVTRDRQLCGVSINEAPTARNDRYEIEPGATLNIVAGNGNDLLANDEDDDDVRNRALSIATTAARQPRHAELFELDADGGFRYRPAPDLIFDGNGRLEDSFAYTVTDGLHPVTGQVVIIIGERNREPVETSQVPGLRIAVADNRDTNVSFDLSRYFSDPDGDTLTYELDAQSPLPGGLLMLDSNGRLGGSVTLADEGSRVLTFRVSDGRATIERTLTINVVRIQSRNNPPVASDIANRRVSGRFSFDVSRYFDDPDGDQLTFSAESLPRDVTIDPDGTISGRARDRNEGIWFIVVVARDEDGASVSDGFLLRIAD